MKGEGSDLHATVLEPNVKGSEGTENGSDGKEIIINNVVSEEARIYVLEKFLNVPVLFDSGSQVSLISGNLWDKRGVLEPETSLVLKGLAGGGLEILGRKNFLLDLGLPKTFLFNLVVVNNNLPYIILGLDFMRKHKLVLDPGREIVGMERPRGWIRLNLWQELSGENSNMIQIAALINSDGTQKRREPRSEEAQWGERKCRELVELHKKVTGEPNRQKVNMKFALDIDFFVDSPISQRPRKFSRDQQTLIAEHFQDLENRGIVVRQSSAYVSPVVLVPKKGPKKFRVCVDYTRVNAQTIPINFPIPLIRDLMLHLKTSHKFFSVLDLREAYYQLPLTRRASERAAIITNEGVFRPLGTQFGLKNAPARFTEMMRELVRGMEGFVFFYLDDFIIFSQSVEQHVDHVGELFRRLEAFGMVIQVEKCSFCETSVTFLGYEISHEGFLPLADNLAAIREMAPPQNVQELRRFLGMINYYHNFIPQLAAILQPLYDLLKGEKVPKRRQVHWDSRSQLAFNKAKQSLVEVSTLTLDDPTKPLRLTTDGSATHCGAVLEVSLQVDINRPMGYFSKAFTKTTRVRSTFNRELSAAFLAVKHFKHTLRGRTVVLVTDHKSLVNAVNNGQGDHSIHESGMIAYIKEFNPRMIHIPGSENPVADSLSRPTVVNQVEVDVQEWEIPSLSDFAAYQYEDPFLDEELDKIGKMKGFKIAEKIIGDSSLWGVEDLDNSHFRPIVPPILRAPIFHVFHNVLHQGEQKSLDAIKCHFFWSSMVEDIGKWVKFCPQCQSCKVSRHNRQTLSNFPDNPPRLMILHLDLVGPLSPAVRQYRYLFTMRDRCTGLVQMVPIENKSADCIASVFLERWVAVFGVPGKVITDNGKEFGAQFDHLCISMGIHHARTTPYHPQANGFIERMHRSLKTALRALPDKDRWVDFIPKVVLAINNQVTDKNSFTPFQKTFGKMGRLPGCLLTVDIEQVESINDAQTNVFCQLMSFHSRQARSLNTFCQMDENLFSADYVWLRVEGLRPSLDPVYEGPYAVIRRSSKYFVIAGYKGPQSVSVDRLKTAFLCNEDLEGIRYEETQSQTILSDEEEGPAEGNVDVQERDFDEPVAEIDASGEQLRPKRVRRAPRRLDL